MRASTKIVLISLSGLILICLLLAAGSQQPEYTARPINTTDPKWDRVFERMLGTGTPAPSGSSILTSTSEPAGANQ